MTKAARYTVIIDRHLGESDGDAYSYHDGTGEAAVAQLAKEIQDAWDTGGVSGSFRITERRIIDWNKESSLEALPVSYEDNPNVLAPGTIVTPVFFPLTESIVGVVITSHPDFPRVAWISNERGVFLTEESPRDLTVEPLPNRDNSSDPTIDHQELASVLALLAKAGDDERRERRTHPE